MTRFHTVYSESGSEQVPFTLEEESVADAVEAAAGVITSATVNAERDMRIASGFSFNGTMYDSRPEDQKRIAGAAQLAFMAIVAGAQPDDLLWHGGTQPFAWIAQDNSIVTMDAQTVVQFGKAAAAWEQAHIFAARALKDMADIPQNFSDAGFWP